MTARVTFGTWVTGEWGGGGCRRARRGGELAVVGGGGVGVRGVGGGGGGLVGLGGQDGLVVGGGEGEVGEDPLVPVLGGGEHLPGVGQEDDPLAEAEGADVDLVAVLLRDGPQVVV